MASLLITHAARLVTPCGYTARHGREMDAVRILEDAALYAEDGIITAVGTTEELQSREAVADTVINAEGKCLLPGCVDSHTHFLFAGYRVEEFMLRRQGATYLELIKTGGIRQTVEDTRAANDGALYKLGYDRLTELMRQGVTTVEGKSGYGLDKETELRQLAIQRKLNREHLVSVVNTFLGAHAIPREYEGNKDGSNVMANMATQCFAGNYARGMSLVSLHNGGGLGIGKVINGGFGMVLDGSDRVDTDPWHGDAVGCYGGCVPQSVGT